MWPRARVRVCVYVCVLWINTYSVGRSVHRYIHINLYSTTYTSYNSYIFQRQVAISRESVYKGVQVSTQHSWYYRHRMLKIYNYTTSKLFTSGLT